MHEACGVRRLHRFEDPHHDLAGFLQAETFSLAGVAVEHAAERFALEHLRHHKKLARVLARVEHGHQRVGPRGLNPLDHALGHGHTHTWAVDHLQRHFLTAREITRGVRGADRPFADKRVDLVLFRDDVALAELLLRSGHAMTPVALPLDGTTAGGVRTT